MNILKLIILSTVLLNFYDLDIVIRHRQNSKKKYPENSEGAEVS